MSAEEGHCKLCVAWTAAWPNIDCANGDPNLDSGPFAGLPRSVFHIFPSSSEDTGGVVLRIAWNGTKLCRLVGEMGARTGSMKWLIQ